MKVKDVYPLGHAMAAARGAGNYADLTTKLKHPDWTVIDSYDDHFAETAPVGSFKPNRFGVFDLGGNVWEWCEDWSDDEQKFTRVARRFVGRRRSQAFCCRRSATTSSPPTVGATSPGFVVFGGLVFPLG